MNKRAENAEQIAEKIREAQEALRTASSALNSVKDLLSFEDPDHLPTLEAVSGAVRTAQYVLASRDFEWEAYAKARRGK